MNLNSQYALEATEAMKLRGLGLDFGRQRLKSVPVWDSWVVSCVSEAPKWRVHHELAVEWCHCHPLSISMWLVAA